MRYRSNARPIRFREIRRQYSFPVALFIWVVLKLYPRLPLTMDVLPVGTLDNYRVHADALPREVLEKFETDAVRLKGSGFKGTIYHKLLDIHSQTEFYSASFVHKSGKVVARLRYRIFRANNPAKEFYEPEFITCCGEERFVVTSAGRADLELPPGLEEERLGTASLDELWTAHRERIRAAPVKPHVLVMQQARDMLLVSERLHRLSVKALVDRKIFVPIEGESAAEVALAERSDCGRQRRLIDGWLGTAC